jgi:hypothetical protein
MSSIVQLRRATCRAACAVLLLAAVCAVSLTAQSPAPGRDCVGSSQAIGAKVWMQASPAAVAERNSKCERTGRTPAILGE